MFVDNVGIAQTFVNMENGTSYPVGRHTVVYVVKDFDGNEAYCRFEIIVDKGTHISSFKGPLCHSDIYFYFSKVPYSLFFLYFPKVTPLPII
jgi:hypothetical protein